MSCKGVGLITIMLFAGVLVDAKNIYVGPKGKDSNPGTLQKPLKSIQLAADRMSPGDTCFILGGRYFETVTIDQKIGTKESPFVFMNYNGEQVVMDGSQEIEGKWTVHADNIYKIKLKDPVWQLFVDGQSMSSARWPNGNWNDGSIWDKTKSMAWPEKGKGEFGHHFNSELQSLDFDLTGAIIIVNSGSFKTFKSLITSHEPGTDNFIYDKSKAWVHGSYAHRVEKHGYFLEGKLELLDAPGEWFYDVKSKILYLWTPNSDKPGNLKIRGKRQSYAFEITNSEYVNITGLDFFSTTFNFYNSTNSRVEDCDLQYPSYSRRMLYDLEPMDVTSMKLKKWGNDAFNSVINCRFEYMDGPVLEMNGSHNLIENNYMHHIDYSCTYAGGWTLNMSKSTDLVFRRNTVHTTGGSELFKAGDRNLIELNDLSKSGFLQNDGSMVQISVSQQDQSITRYNWVHNSVKQGLRFDNMNSPGAKYGHNGTMHHNVSWQTDRIYFKGDDHFIFNNVSFDSHLNDLIISSNKEIQGHNHQTITRNNLSNKFSGHRTKPGSKYPVPGIVDHNWAGDVKGKDLRTQLRDPDNLDFRPKENAEIIDAGVEIEGKPFHYLGKAPEIGAYEYDALDYWIPGFQDKIASVPIPPHEGDNVQLDADLMWLYAYLGEDHRLYFSDSLSEITKATKGSFSDKGSFQNNIYDPGKLQSGKTYYWRVDATINDEVRKGNVWKFTTK